MWSNNKHQRQDLECVGSRLQDFALGILYDVETTALSADRVLPFVFTSVCFEPSVAIQHNF